MRLLSSIRVESSDLVVSHHQYADTTIIPVDATIENLWTIKDILCRFELALGLRVNFAKSSLIGVNSDQTFLDLACEFLHYKMKYVPFKCLGFPVGANPRLTSTWKPLVNLLYIRLLSWKHMHASLGGRVILHNYVLNVIHIFFLSILKMYVKVWKKIVKIYMRFFWICVKEEFKIA